MRAHGFPGGKRNGMTGRAFNECMWRASTAIGINMESTSVKYISALDAQDEGSHDLMAVHEWVCMGLVSCWASAVIRRLD